MYEINVYFTINMIEKYLQHFAILLNWQRFIFSPKAFKNTALHVYMKATMTDTDTNVEQIHRCICRKSVGLEDKMEKRETDSKNAGQDKGHVAHFRMTKQKHTKLKRRHRRYVI